MNARAVPPVLAGIAIGAVTTAVWMDREDAWRRWSDWAEKRIRELEAELDAWKGAAEVQKARAEKAEADYASACATLMSVGSRLDGEIETRQRAEARVAELEAEVAYLNGIVRSSNLRGHATRQYEPALAIEGQEREEC